MSLISKRAWNGPAASRGRAQELAARRWDLAVRGNVGGRTLARRTGGQPLATGAATQGCRVARGSAAITGPCGGGGARGTRSLGGGGAPA